MVEIKSFLFSRIRGNKIISFFYSLQKGYSKLTALTFRGVFRNLSNVYDGALSKNCKLLQAVNYFHKNFHLIWLKVL